MPPSRRSHYEDANEDTYADVGEPYRRHAAAEVTAEEDEFAEDVYDEVEPSRGRALDAATAGRAGMRYIVNLTGRDPEGVTLVQPTEQGWLVGVEVVEDQRIPSSGDILAIYEAEIDDTGNLLAYRRTRRYRRGTGGEGISR